MDFTWNNFDSKWSTRIFSLQDLWTEIVL